MYFIDRNQIENALAHMEKLLTLYNEEKEWTTDLIHSLAVARLSHVIIESVIDVGNSMIDGFIMRDPGGYDDIIDIMEDEKVITPEMSNPLKLVIGLRKMIVRDFTNVSPETIVEVLNQSMEALIAFPEKVRRYLEHELGPVSAFLPSEEDQ
ncbi:DUF86 domain-containing protein [Sporosarcina sp. Marseille-Q4063]|uniref:DUF86 domain-containing protein n=1 Tax=Sporosarcina sp. Marseille-Q4063 TaxID=2810514 RepID=UPI001BB08FE2|nr:DUF86 domain-containing protein [Sporosarcina sp. Marseille-Q4063]QUW23254.1 DUF86 domain-containing protein [Sporosarcina sp. Marseille-Q4063]